jgi:hypothetical protein
MVHRSLSVTAALLASLTACSSTDTGPSPTGGSSPPPPPAHVINEQKTHTSVHADQPFTFEVVLQLRTTDALPDLDVRSLALLGGDVFVGTASGLMRWSPAAQVFTKATTTGSGPILDMAVLEGTKLLLARDGGVEIFDPKGGAGEVWAAGGAGITSVIAAGTDVFIGNAKGLSRLSAAAETPVAAAQGLAVRDLAVAGGVVWMATAAGVRRYDIASDKLLPDIAGSPMLPDNDVRALTVTSDGKNEILAATAKGLARVLPDGSKSTLVLAGLDGLPNGDLRAVAEAGGEVLTGHGIGATALRNGRKDHYHTARWIPDEEVTAVALAADKTAWIGTPEGVSRISFEPRTLDEKAAIFEPMNEMFWRMDGFVSDTISYDDPYIHEGEPERRDHDNDGLWTEMQVAAWCFAYASTGDELYYERARKAMDTMFLLQDVPGETFAAAGKPRGFIARSLVRDDEGSAFSDKASSDRWHKQEYKGRTYYWKNDTSSDEYDGHFFGIPVFYDLCAKTDEERKAIRDRIDMAMGTIVDNGNVLLDLDGEPTTFGFWNDLSSAVDGDLGACLASGKLHCIESYGGGGWLNSIEILGHLLATWHITGNDRYYHEYERLVTDERYGEMLTITDHTFTVTSRSQANHSDHELASLAYYTLLRYEPNPERRAKWIESLLSFYGYEKPERNALEHAVMASALETDDDLAGAVLTLSEWPVDLREWKYDNSHRMDAELDVPDRFDKPQFKTIFPYDEIRTFKWNSNPYAVSGGGSGKSMQAPWPYLLPYWMMRYYGAIASP